MLRRHGPWLTAVLLVAACQQPLPPKEPLVQTIAVLPFDNASNDLNAADIMQKLVYGALKNSLYQTVDIQTTNKKLSDVGIVDGGQLPVLDPVKIAKDFGVQALVYGSVENFDYTNVGYFLSRKVRLDLRVVDGTTGQILWEHSGTGATRRIATNNEDAQKNLAVGLAEQMADKVFKNPLAAEARLATLQALYSLPGFVFNGFAEDKSGIGSTHLGAQNAVKDIFFNKKKTGGHK